MSWGFAVLLLAGVCQGSFGLGYKKYNPFSWEAFWGVYSTYCLIVPLIWTFIQVPDFISYLSSASLDRVIIPILCGFLWGISAIGFSKSVDYIGVSLVYGLSMGVSAVVGSVIPLFGMEPPPETMSLIFIFINMSLTVVGIAVITKAGMIKDEQKKADAKPAKMKLGLLLAMVSGLGSGAMNIGFDYASEIGGKIIESGYSEIGASAVQWLLVLFGGFISGVGYCVIMLFKNKTWHTFTEKGSVKRLSILFGTCLVWFTALAAYGIATLMIGDFGAVIGWILFNALALIISNIWGLKTGEWKDSGKAKIIMGIGNLVLIVSWIFIALV